MLAALLLALLAATAVAAAAAPLPAHPTVNVTCGEAMGDWERGRDGREGLAVFRGIPFGASERFMPPTPAPCWSGTLDAREDGPVCWQARDGGAYGRQSEDCLSLNVYSYEMGAELARDVPVLVWIYGGSATTGGVSYYGDSGYLAEPGRAVVVAMNYRVNVFGFLALRELSEVDPRGTSGNLGVLDVQLALRWVQANIARFGGDPSRVTLLGQSTGGTQILALLGSPASAGLFAGAVSLSGSPNITMSLREAEEQNRAGYLARTGCQSSPAGVLACLRAMSARRLAALVPTSWDDDLSSVPRDRTGIHWPGLIIVDGVTVPRPLLDSLADGLVDVPAIIQNVQAENDAHPDPGEARANATEVRGMFRDALATWGNADEAYELYRAEVAAACGDPDSSYPWYAMPADTGVTCGSVALARAAAAGFRSPVYVGIVQASPASPVSSGGGARDAFPFHGWDLMAGAGFWDEMSSSPEYDPQADDLALGAALREQWYTLASNGSLAAVDGGSWRPVSPGGAVAHGVIRRAGKTETVPGYKARACEFWASAGVDQRFWWVN